MQSFSKFGSLAVIGAGVVLAGTASADTINAGTVTDGIVLEYDFNNPTTGGGTGTNANIVANGGSPDADLVGGNSNSARPDLGSTYTAATGLGAEYDPALQTGYLSLSPVDGPDQGLSVANTTGNTDHRLGSYMGESTLDQGSIVVFFKPHADGQNTLRETFFWSGPNSSSASLIWLMNDDDFHGPTLRTGGGILAKIDNFEYDSDTWYMLGASWEADDISGAQNVIYIRALTPGSTATSVVSSALLADTNGQIDGAGAEVYLGRRGDTQVDGANADLASLVLLNTSITVEGFDAIYASIPEPASSAILLISGGLLICRRRKA